MCPDHLNHMFPSLVAGKIIVTPFPGSLHFVIKDIILTKTKGILYTMEVSNPMAWTCNAFTLVIFALILKTDVKYIKIWSKQMSR